MNTEEAELFHRVIAPERKKTGEKSPTVIMLHGRGANEDDLLGLAQYLDDRLLVISARAPYPFPYDGGYTWYDMDEQGVPDLRMFRSSYDRLRNFVEMTLKNLPVDPKRLFLLGFSMGTMMSFALSLTSPELFRGVVAYSGYVPERTGLVMKWSELLDTSFFIAHGIFDPVIPVTMARRTEALFRQSNARWTYREYPMAHEISPESLTESAAWLQSLL